MPSDADAGSAGIGGAGSAGVGRHRLNRNVRPIEIIMACEAGRISIG